MYGSPELKQETIKHYGELVMGEESEGLVDKAVRIKSEVAFSVSAMPVAVKAMGGSVLAGIIEEMCEVMCDMADRIETLECNADG